MVADAVTCEPVSTAKFPANREKNSEFCKIPPSGAPEAANSGVVTGVFDANSLLNGTENYFGGTGKLGVGTGNFIDAKRKRGMLSAGIPFDTRERMNERLD